MRVLGAGDNVVDRYPTLGREFPGGNAVNVAVFARRLGAEAAYLGALGSDGSGRLVLDSLRTEGVETELVRIVDGPNAFAEVRLEGSDRIFAASDRGVAVFEPGDEDFAAMSGFDVVHTAYTGPFAPYVAAMAERTRVSFDFGTRHDPYGDHVREMLPALFLASFSGSHLAADGAERLARDAVSGGAVHALVTRGAEGAYLVSETGLTHGRAEQVAVRDTLGAGDAFIAATLVGLLDGRAVPDILATASAHAAGVCTDYGAFGYGTPLNGAASRGAHLSTDKTGSHQ